MPERRPVVVFAKCTPVLFLPWSNVISPNSFPQTVPFMPVMLSTTNGDLLILKAIIPGGGFLQETSLQTLAVFCAESSKELPEALSG